MGQLWINLGAARSEGRCSDDDAAARGGRIQPHGRTGQDHLALPKLQSQRRSRPANHLSDSMGQVSNAASSTAPTTTSLIRMRRLFAKFAKPEQRVSASPLTYPACIPLLAINDCAGGQAPRRT